MATIDFTNGVTLSDAGWADDVDVSAYSVLTAVSGTNTIVATGAATYSYAATRPPIWFIPANTNTSATTINVTPSGGAALGAKNIFWNGAACVGGELRQNVPAALIYDGTQLHIIANGFSAPFSDAHAVVEGSADATKKARFEVDGLTPATTRVVTIPNADGTMAYTVAGTFTAALTGCTAGVNGTANYTVTGNVVTVHYPVLSGTSNTTSATVTGQPAAIQPTTAHLGLVGITQNNSATPVFGRVDVGTDGVLALYVDSNSATFTSGNVKGLPAGLTITYNLN